MERKGRMKILIGSESTNSSTDVFNEGEPPPAAETTDRVVNVGLETSSSRGSPGRSDQPADDGGNETPRSQPGILRIDSTTRPPRYAVAAPLLCPQAEPPSPQPSVDRLSVTFAIAEDRSMNNPDDAGPNHRSQLSFVSIVPVVAANSAETRRVPAITDGEDDGDEDDYSASACAIIQRRASLRRQSRRKRRSSSPFSRENAENVVRRRSSAYTTSSGDTAISVEDGGTQEQIYENLKLHKEVLGGVKQQPWPLRRKMKLVQQAKSYVRRHEGALQERLAQSRSTRDVIARASILINKKWQYFRRELVNLQTWLIPWELRVKEIESHFGSAVASYFIFLRWLFWINLVISGTLAAFVAIPEMLTARSELAGERKIMLPEERIKSKHLVTLWEFEGVLKYSPFFYGWYTNVDSGSGYRLPLAYFVANLVVYIYSFGATLRKMAENSRMSKLSEKEDECAFSWKLFTGWDFMIGNPETAHNRIASIVLGFKEALLEEAEKAKVERNWKITAARIFVNLSVISLLALSAYAVVEVVARSIGLSADANWWRQNEITIVMSLISYIFPIFFEILGIFENYHPRKQLRLQLARIMVLNLLNLYSMIIALFDKISSMEVELQSLKPNNTGRSVSSMNCINVSTPCSGNSSYPAVTLASLSLVLLSNITSMNVNYGTSPNVAETLSGTMENDTISYSTLQRYTSSFGTVDDFNSTFNYDSFEMDYNNYTEIEQSADLYANNNSTFDNVTDTILITEAYNATSEIMDFNDSWTSGANALSTSNIDFTDTADDLIGSTSPIFQTTTELTTSELPTDDSMTVSDLENKDKRVEGGSIKCYYMYCKTQTTTTTSVPPKAGTTAVVHLNITTRRKLRRLCWETMFGQELAKLTVMDLVLTIIMTLSMDFFRAVFVRFMNNCWCWDLEKQFPQYGDFKIAENILHLVYNQGMVWMGMFFSPGLAVLNLLKLGILMYLRSWAVLTCNVPHEVVFRASRSNNFYFALLLTMLFLCVLPVGYAIVWVEPSWHCGPFSNHLRIYHLATKTLKGALHKTVHRIVDYIASPGIVIPLIVLMALIIYYMVSLTGSLREANNDLKIQLRQERTEERRKMFQIAEKRQDVQETPFVRWKKILPVLPSSKSTAGIGIVGSIVLERKKARKRSATSEAGEATDVEQDSLPNDPAQIPQEVSDDVITKKRKLVKQMSNNRSYSSGSIKEGDSLGSQWSDYGVIPKIRISRTEGGVEAGHYSSPKSSAVAGPP